MLKVTPHDARYAREAEVLSRVLSRSLFGGSVLGTGLFRIVHPDGTEETCRICTEGPAITTDPPEGDGYWELQPGETFTLAAKNLVNPERY